MADGRGGTLWKSRGVNTSSLESMIQTRIAAAASSAPSAATSSEAVPPQLADTMQHLARFHDDIREPPLESSLSPSSGSDRLAAVDDGLMRFWVLKFYASSSQAVERVLEINVLDGSFRVVNPHKQTHKSLSIRHISQLELSIENEQNCRVLFFGNVPSSAAVDFAFRDAAARAGFCELLQTINSNIVCQDAAPAPVLPAHPEWVDDADAPCCMRCGVGFSLLQRRHHCRLCGNVCCATCSSHTAVLPNLYDKRPVRVCFRCHEIIAKSRVASIKANGGNENLDVTSVLRHGSVVKAPSAGLLATPSVDAASGGGGGAGGAGGSLSPTASSAPKTPGHLLRGASLEARSAESSASATASPSLFGGIERDSYGFTVKPVRSADADDFDDDADGGSAQSANAASSSHSAAPEVNWEPQRRLWNSYLALHPRVSKDDSELKALVRNGIPPELRGSIWQILADSKKLKERELPSYYRALVEAGQTHATLAAAEIEKDLHRTFPNNVAFESEKGIDTLRSVLLAYSVRNPKIGYCQSMNFVCALLLLFMNEEDAFWMLTFIQEETTCISGSFYYQSDLAGAHIDQAVFLDLIKEKLPQVYVKFQSLEFPLQPLTINWFLCLYIHAVPLETTLRIWDVMFYEGSKILFRVALSLLKINESTIMAATRMDDLMQFIKDVPRTTQDASYVMKCCFDPLWIGSFPQSRIDQLRKRHQEDVIRRMSKTRDERAAMAAQSKLRREAAALKLAAAANEAAKQVPPVEDVNAADGAASQDTQSTKTDEVDVGPPQISDRIAQFQIMLGHARPPMIENFFPDNASVSSSTPVSAPLASMHADSSMADDGFVLVSHPGRLSPPPPAQPAMPPPPPPQPSVAPPPPPLPKRPNHSNAASDSQPQPFSTPIAQGSARNLVFSPDTLAAVQSIPYIAVETDDSPLSGAVRCKVTYTPMRASESDRGAVGGDSDGGALMTPSSSSGANDSHLPADSGALFATPVAPPRVHALASALNAASSSTVAAARGSGVPQSPFGGTPLASPAARAAVRNLIANRAAAVGGSNKKPPQPNRPPPPPPPV